MAEEMHEHEHTWMWRSKEEDKVPYEKTGTIKESLEKSAAFKELALKKKDKKLVILKQDKAIASHFPCDKMIDLKMKNLTIHDIKKGENQTPPTSHVSPQGEGTSPQVEGACPRPILPSIMMGNVRSLNNKMDSLAQLVKEDHRDKDCSFLCICETWLTQDDDVDLPGFTTVRADRDRVLCGKARGGGLALFINNKRCDPEHVMKEESVCSTDIELLAVSLRPYNMPKVLSQTIVVVVVYVPPRANRNAARDIMHSTIAPLQTQHPGTFIVISGDFNQVPLDPRLLHFYQFVNFPTRNGNKLDLLYANVRDAYTAEQLPKLGKSDHNMILLEPKYKTDEELIECFEGQGGPHTALLTT